MSVRDEVRERSGGNCEIRLVTCKGRAQHQHHRLRRSQGGPDTADNLLDCCWSCHDAIHAHPAESYEKGWLRRRFEESDRDTG